MSKAKVNALLKEQFGLANIKMKSDYSGFNTKTVKVGGKMVKGVELRSHSPMDCTSVPTEQVNAMMAKIRNALCYIVKKDGDRFVVAETSKSITYLGLNVERYATYTRCMNLDDGYQTSYMVPCFYTEKK